MTIRDEDAEYFSRLSMLWHSRSDSWEIAKSLGLPEHQVERDLHIMLDRENLLRIATSRSWRECSKSD